MECDAYLGEPPVYPLSWIRYRMEISPDTYDRNTITIINIDYEDAGIYECGFNVLGRAITAFITVTVHEINIICRPPSPSIHFSYASQQSLNLTCDCRTDFLDLECQWNIRNLSIVRNNSLVIPYYQVSTGVYIYQILRAGVLVEQHIVMVTVVNIPPLPEDCKYVWQSHVENEH